MVIFIILIVELPFYYRQLEQLKLYVLQRQSAKREAQLEGVLDILPDGVVILRKDNSKCVFKNQSANSMFKFERKAESNGELPSTSMIQESE